MDSVNFIVTAKHYSERYGADGTAKAFILKWREKLHKEKNITIQIKGIDAPQGTPVKARIWQGQWVADCDVENCGGCEFVEPTEPLFFCFSCVNRLNNGYVRPVEFPEQWKEIEELVLARPVNDVRGQTDLERAHQAKAAVVVVADGNEFHLTRSWRPEESLEELLEQNKVLKDLQVKAGETVVIVKEAITQFPDIGIANGI